MKISEDQLTGWTKPPSDSEEKRCENAVSLIQDAINNDSVLSKKHIRVFGQGSYQNNTNVRLNSDVDVCVMLEDVFYFNLPEGKTRADFGLNSPSNYTFTEFKNSVETALKRKFGNDVKRGNKSLKIRSNTARVDADVVPAFEYRRYTGSKNYDSSHEYHDGIKFFSDSGDLIINYPKQHGENGNTKNTQTNRSFKKVARLLKKINYELNEDGYIPSFLIECLAWNVPNSVFTQNYTYADMIRGTLNHIYHHTKNENAHLCDEWGEVSELLYLFKGHSKWTKKNAEDFAVKAWNYVGFE